ncbi:cytochrome P450 [Gulosibacter chungangensis]|uniref:Cytochrome P450 n=1 Tax=Gulosibacter chungangensis TaxID=979746 RepID=A0A7J5BFV6_9MICO|nr:cytochrome P450 [Gulosibacter chungangensis]KAB1645135.1 cytochrome P450 [Gulosibacter chungangensis]
MSETNRTPTVDFDHNSAEHSVDPVASYRQLRKDAPVAWTEAWGGYWVLSGHDAVFDAARDDDTFSSARHEEFGVTGQAITLPQKPMALHLPIELDPPESQKYRSIMNKLITPKQVRKILPMIDKYVDMFIDELIETGEADFASLTGVPAIVTIDWLGMPMQDWRRHAKFHRDVLAEPLDSEAYRKATQEEMPYLVAQIEEAIQAHRENPTDEAISFIVQQEIDGRPITDEEAFSMIELLISGGVGTTASLTGQALVWISEHPEAKQQLLENPDLMQTALEEFLRVFSPTQALSRTVMKDVEFHGVQLKRGDRALLSWSSANRDLEDTKDNPDEVDLARSPNRHLAFGVGSHRCAGSHLARPLARSIITKILERMPDYKVDTDKAIRYERQGVNTGYQTIPATFTPGERVYKDESLSDFERAQENRAQAA